MKVLLLILISISLITKQVEHFFECFSAVWVFSSEICLLIFFFFAHSSIMLFVFLIDFKGFFFNILWLPIFCYMHDCVIFQLILLGFFRYIWIICKWYCTFFLNIFEGVACISRRHFANLYYSDNWTVGLYFSQLTPN